MFIADPVVFIDLPKTASSHVRRLLADIVGGREVGVHVPATPRLRRRYRHFWATVRNPWDWYVSLWAYGCSGRGTLFRALTSDLGWLRSRGWKQHPGSALGALLAYSRRHRDAWRAAYADVDSPACFRAWLSMLNDPRHAGDPGEAYAASGLANFAGLLTWRYLRLTCDGDPRGLTDAAALARFEAGHCYITRFLRTDRLEADLEAAFEDIGRPLSADQRAILARAGRSNASSRRRDPGFYYDAASVALVGERDRLLVDRFGFTPPRV